MSSQQRMGATVPDLVTSPGVPALVLPTSVDEFDGWTADDVTAWLKRVGEEHAAARLAIGLALWKLLELQADEDVHQRTLGELADLYDVDRSTLWRWRKAAQQRFELPEPKAVAKRSDSQQRRRKDEQVVAPRDNPDDTPTPVGTESREVPAVDPDGESPAPSTSGTVETPGPAASSAPQEPPAFKAVIGSDDPTELCSMVDQLMKVGTDRMAQKLGLERSRKLAGWAGQVERRAIQHSAESRAAAYRQEHPERPRDRREVTPHWKGNKK